MPQVQKETKVHKKVLDPETSQGAVLALEKVSLDSIFKKQSRYICRVPTERPGHEVLPTRAREQWPRELPV